MNQKRYISSEEAENWRKLAGYFRSAHEQMEDARLLMLTKMEVNSKALEAVERALDVLSGQAYMFTPQSEWIGGDSDDPKNHKTRLPHIARNSS